MFASHISVHVVQTSTFGDNRRGAASMQLDESSVITLSKLGIHWVIEIIIQGKVSVSSASTALMLYC